MDATDRRSPKARVQQEPFVTVEAREKNGEQAAAPPTSRQNFIFGTGEMADLTRAFDWSQTPVGPIEQWPETLLITVNIMLASRHPMFLWWGKDLVQFYNDAYRPSLGADKHPVALGQNGIDCWPEVWHLIGPQIEAVMTSGQACWHEDQLVPIFRDGKLEEVYWTYGYSPVRDSSGTICGTLVVCTETTRRFLAEQRQITSQAALMQTEKLAAVGRLASSIAHEINNPLESVTNLIYLARESAWNPETREYLDIADRELRRVSVIANQTLRFHKQSSKPQWIACQGLIGSAFSVYQGRLVNSSVEVERRTRATSPVLCFQGEIQQVLSNLIINAIDAMHPHGGRLLMRSREGTDWKTGRKGLILTVADTGSGMSPDTATKIFEPFFTTKEIGGTGLGLWVSYEIVQRHGGTLAVRSSQRKGHSGTVFTLFLPFEAVVR
jgi:nitrogen-specific signal transduction histidine kinase